MVVDVTVVWSAHSALVLLKRMTLRDRIPFCGRRERRGWEEEKQMSFFCFVAEGWVGIFLEKKLREVLGGCMRERCEQKELVSIVLSIFWAMHRLRLHH